MLDFRMGRSLAACLALVCAVGAGPRTPTTAPKPNTGGELPAAADPAGPRTEPAEREARATPAVPVVPERPAAAALDVRLDTDAFGRSGALRAWLVLPEERFALPLDWKGARPDGVWYRWTRQGVAEQVKAAPGGLALGVGDSASAPAAPGVYRLEVGLGSDSRTFEAWQLVVQVPIERKEGAYLQGYRIGRYPDAEDAPTQRYAPPAGFIEVTRENQEVQLSEHFKVREFLTKDQRNVWPKYVVIDPRLLDKLELVLQDLESRGVRAERMVVMSGFRTPQYNRKGLNQGRATYSRHQYGDAADVWVDNDLDWYMDDLNDDGRRDTRDARVILESVARVEARYPELVGGAGIYRDNGVHGPFIHIDARGYRARW